MQEALFYQIHMAWVTNRPRGAGAAGLPFFALVGMTFQGERYH